MDGKGTAAGQGTAQGQKHGGAAHTPYLSLIDGVRGIAALSILFYHYVHFFMAGSSRKPAPGATGLFPAYDQLWPLYDYGYYAVQIFWLISGFVFAHVYYGHRATTRSFFVNRFARLYPLHLATLLSVTALNFIALERIGYTPLYGKFDLQHFGLQLFMASDWIREGGGYSFNGPIWSVSVEILVYALFWASRGLVQRWGLPLVAALVLGFYFAHTHYGEHSRAFSCAFYFFIGCGLCLVHRGRWGRGRPLALLAAGLAAAGLVGAFQEGDWGWRYIGIPGLFGSLFLILAEAQQRVPAGLGKACQWLGENTYGIYLWHVPVQLAALMVLMPGTDPQALARNWWFLASFLVLVVVLARTSFVLFERPARDRLRHWLGGHAPAGRVGAP